jgi:hypothetical protein
LSIQLSRFARQRLFGSEPRVLGVGADAFEDELNRRKPEAVLDGYAPFCKLHVHRNWTDTPLGAIRITPENEPLLKSAYEARTADELPVLTRWFEGLVPPIAAYLIVILYSREQMVREGEELEADWGVVGLLATESPEEIPMAPITMMRNALGVEEGGSGVAIDREAYLKSVEFWNTHANWRPAPRTES